MSSVAMRRGHIQAGWRQVSLGDICSKPQYGWTTKAKVESGELKLLRTTDITSGLIDWTRVPFCTELPPDPHKYLVRDGDILISRAGSVGVSHLVASPEPSVFASYLIRFTPGPDVLPKYLAYFLKSPAYWKQIADNTAGIAIPNVNASKLQELRIPLAPIEEQHRIVAELETQFSRLDEAVANLNRVKANLLAYKQAAVREAIRGDLSAEPAAEGLPVGWSRVPLSELGEFGRGKSKHRPRDDPRLYGGPYPFIQTGDVRRSAGVIREFTQTYSEFGLQQSRLWPAGTLCITIAANIAETGILAMPACFPDSVVGLVCDDAALVRYVELYFRTIRANLERFAPATAQKNINLSVLERVQVPLPPASERERIVTEVDRRLSIVQEVEAQVEANQRRAALLRSSCLAASFSAARIRKPPEQLEIREEASD